jgi:signal transduction histidine kinase
MALTLRQRIVVTVLPLLILLAGTGGAGIAFLYWVGGRIDEIMRENYQSVVAMVGLNEALERIDSSFGFALLGRADARQVYARNWQEYDRFLNLERANITLPGERELVEELNALTQKYHAEGDRFFASGTARSVQSAHYLGTSQELGLLKRFEEIKRVSGEIRRINQDNMEEASASARRTAAASVAGLAGLLAVATLLALVLVWTTQRGILRPVRAMTDAALAIGAGNLNQEVPIVARDELGELARAFNRMAAQLRDYRQSHLARLLRVQRTAQATIDSFPDPVLVVAPGGRVEMANPAARQVFGVAPGGAAAAAELPWQPPESLRQPLTEALRDQRSYLTQSFAQVVTFRLEGDDRAFLPQILPISDPYGFTLGAAVVLNDVTRFQLLDRLKSDLVATVSHELKTPLTSVRLVLHLLLEETVGPLTPKQTELLVDARDNAERLLNMIEQLLALARLEQGREPLVLQPESPGELLCAAADAARPRAEAKRIDLVVEEVADTPPVAVDAGRIGRVLNNLLDNALIYTEEGGKVTLSARPADPKVVTFSVADTGIGIPPEYVPHVFDRFFRVPLQSRGQSTGLGLAIAREIVAAHGGTIACASTPGKGTVFTITLPASSATANALVWGNPERVER